jgi:ABC-type phosphate transport system substrate-binding protein
MKFNKLALVCAVACVTFAGQASAQLSGANLTTVTNAKTAAGGARVLYISGASAVQGGFNQIAGTLLQAGFIRFQSPSANDYRAVAGKLVSSAGGWAAGSDVIIINRAKGGSVFGVNPVARNEKIESINISAAGCTTGAGTSASPYVCALTTDSTGATPSTDDDFIAPDAGVSDVAPSLFDGLFNTEGEPGVAGLSAAELALLTPTPIYTLAFGVPMSDNLPLFNINKSALSAVMAGNVGTWDVVNSALPADDVLVCRRVNGSGSQAVANLYYGNYPCDTGARANVPADRSAGSAWNGVDKFLVEGNTGAANVVENSTSGDVRSCLNNAFDASAKAFVADGLATPGTLNPATRTISGAVGYTGYVSSDRAGNPVAVQFRDGRAHKAVGVLSMDSLSNSTATSKWTFRAMDGAGEITWGGVIATPPVVTGTGRVPTLANLTDGTWDQQGVISINVPARTTGNKAALMADFVAQAQSPAVLAAQTGLKFAAASLPGTPDPTATGNVTRAGYSGGDQCAPLNRNN